jgi:lipoprotein-anchoring transpeptidase ErfK/SrfK
MKKSASGRSSLLACYHHPNHQERLSGKRMNSIPDPPEQRRAEGHRVVVIRIAGMIFLGAALLLVVMSLTILRSEPIGSHALPSSVSSSSATRTSSSPASVIDTATTHVPAPQLSAYQQARAAGGYLTAAAAVDQLQIYDRVPPGSQLMLAFPRAGMKQISSTFLIIGEDVDAQGRVWYQIRLPIRPNGSTGWVRATDVTTATIVHSIHIDLSDHRLDLYESGQLKASYPIGVGTGDTPTPPGEYYITIKLKPTLPNSVYGVLAMGVSGFSEKLTDWPDGGQLGIHGTNDPSSIGKDVSHGCIRLQNADILDLSQYVAYGTPVVIQE